MNSVFGRFSNIHFVGIGGIGMSGIAEVLHNMGFVITGSDISENTNVKMLRNIGIKINIGHDEANVEGADVIVYTSAAKDDNPELVKARQERKPVIMRGEMLSELMRLKFAVAVAGSHGKTTTTSMVAEIVKAAKLDPTVLIGGRLNSTNNNASYGKSNIMIAEADESDRSFLMLYPSIAIITNIDHEHMESYKDFDDVKASFTEFANMVPFYGTSVLCIDSNNVADIIPNIKKRFITYGTKAQADIRAVNVKKDGFSISYDVKKGNEILGHIEIMLPGDHIVLNSLAALTVAMEMGIEFDIIADALKNFSGVQRRMSVRYKSDKYIVIDDYGHHPTEISTTLKAVREASPESSIVVVFQPHRYTRTRDLMSEFAKCFMDVDRLYITDIYAASEKAIEGITAEKLISEVKNHGFKDVSYLPDLNDFLPKLDEISEKHSVIMTFGAGSITNFSYTVADYLKERGR